MGGRFSRRRNQIDPNLYNDPFYQGASIPPTGAGGPYGYQPGYEPYGGLSGYEPDPYGYGYNETDPFQTYGAPMGRGPNHYGGRYGRGYSQMSGMSPWNYGNYYLGNTTMQMIPMMQRKLAKYGQQQAMGGGMGGGMGGFMPMMPSMPCMPAMPCMPMMPCMQPACSMPMAAPMMAVAAPLPVAYNPLIQGMYPMVTANTANWMSPTSFMSALTTGPMPYRPPASFELPNNISAVMTVPYGAQNPLLASPSFGGFSPQNNFGGGMSCCCCYCAPSCAPSCAPPPAISYYPRPVCVPQPYPVPCPAPVPIPNIQQVPVPRPVTVIAPPIIAGCNPGMSIPSGAPLMPFQGGFTQNGFGQSLVMASNDSTSESLLNDETSVKPKREKPAARPVDQSRRIKAQQIAASLSNLGLSNNECNEITSSKKKNRIKSNRATSDYGSLTVSKGNNIDDSDWLTSDALSDILDKTKARRHGKSTARHSRTHRHRYSSISDHNCVACKHEQLDKFS